MPLDPRGRTGAGRGWLINLLLGNRNPLDSEAIKTFTHPKPDGISGFAVAPVVLVKLSPDLLNTNPIGVGRVFGLEPDVAKIIKRAFET